MEPVNLRIHSPGPDQCIGNFKGLFAGIRLRNKQFININPERIGINRIKRMLGIDKGRDPALALDFCRHMKSQCGFTGTFRAVNFNHPSPWQAADTKGNIKTERAG